MTTKLDKTDKQLIKKIEEIWFALQAQRMTELQKEVDKVPDALILSAVQLHNINPKWENRFDALASALKLLDPSHDFLTENQIHDLYDY